ncbi:MAG: hypothetical protein Q9M92_14125 [Enterobacterales bacterium]|nr:hypothetical protein [Enterobacterales bacterium]
MNDLTLNIDDGTLLTYRVGAPIPAGFGRENYSMLEAGYSINIFEDSISSIFVCFREGYEDFKNFKGAVTVNKKKFNLNSNSSYDEVVAIFGEPKDTWNDGVEQCAEFEKNGINIEVIWHVDGVKTLDYISLEI